MNADVVFVRKQTGNDSVIRNAANNWQRAARAAVAMTPTLSTTSTNGSIASNPSGASTVPQDNFLRRLFRRGNTAPAVAPPQQEPVQTTTYKERYDAFLQKFKNWSGMLYYILGIIVSFIFIIVGSVLMSKKNSSHYPYCHSDNCYATTDGHGRFILSDATDDPYMNEHSSYLTGVVLLFFGIACACLTLVVYFRKK
jgi:hypothetical protein